MRTIEPTTDNAPSLPCPACGEAGRGTLRCIDERINTADMICKDGHIFTVRWLTSGAA